MWWLAFIGVVFGEVLDCPPSGNVFPCECHLGFYNDLEIDCNDLESVDQVYEPFKHIRGLKLGLVYFYNLNISKSIKSDAFVGTSVKEFILSDSAINLEAPQFVGLEDSLKEISFFNSTNFSGTLAFGHLSKLAKLVITKNEIDYLPDGWLASAPDSLSDIWLNKNGLKSLGEHAFSDLTSVVLFHLDENKLTTLKRSMFPKPAMKLAYIDISLNQVSHLPSDMFTEMPALTHLIMKKNFLTTLDMATWSHVLPQLEELYFHGNPLQCESSMEWLFAAWTSPHTRVFGVEECESPEYINSYLNQTKTLKT